MREEMFECAEEIGSESTFLPLQVIKLLSPEKFRKEIVSQVPCIAASIVSGSPEIGEHGFVVVLTEFRQGLARFRGVTPRCQYLSPASGGKSAGFGAVSGWS